MVASRPLQIPNELAGWQKEGSYPQAISDNGSGILNPDGTPAGTGVHWYQ